MFTKFKKEKKVRIGSIVKTKEHYFNGYIDENKKLIVDYISLNQKFIGIKDINERTFLLKFFEVIKY